MESMWNYVESMWKVVDSMWKDVDSISNVMESMWNVMDSILDVCGIHVESYGFHVECHGIHGRCVWNPWGNVWNPWSNVWNPCGDLWNRTIPPGIHLEKLLESKPKRGKKTCIFSVPLLQLLTTSFLVEKPPLCKPQRMPLQNGHLILPGELFFSFYIISMY